MGGFITQSHLGWRWTQWITLIMATLFGTMGAIVIPETYHPVILQKKAKRLRYQMRNWAIHAEADEKEINAKEIANKYLLRPFKMLLFEPILVLVTLYISLIYGIIYGFFEVFPVSFQEQRGYNLGVGSLPFLSILVGVVIGCLIITYTTRTRFARKMRETGQVVPEERLIPMIIGGAALPIGMFWFAWTSSPNISPWPQIIAAVPIGKFFAPASMNTDIYLPHLFSPSFLLRLTARSFPSRYRNHDDFSPGSQLHHRCV